MALSTEVFRSTLAGMRDHPQGHHGWAAFYDTLHHLMGLPDMPFTRVLHKWWQERPEMSHAHAAVLLALAVRSITNRHSDGAEVFDDRVAIGRRADQLRAMMADFEPEISQVVLGRCNSFTGARRFLLHQVLLGQFARHHCMPEVRLLDLGTGLGILPRQLNHRGLYDRFAPDLTWPDPQFSYVDIPLTARDGVDLPPLPTVDWVRDCHGPSPYYEARFGELRSVLDALHTEARICELDILRSAGLRGCLRDGRYNAVTCNFVLYQYERRVTERVVRDVVGAMPAPGVFISVEPSRSLALSGCEVNVYLAGSPQAIHVADISDGHFIGAVLPARDYRWFTHEHLGWRQA